MPAGQRAGGWAGRAIAFGIRIIGGLRRGRTMNRQDAKAPRKRGSGGIGGRVRPIGALASWRLGGSVGRQNPDLSTAGGHVAGADSVSLSRKFQMRFPWALGGGVGCCDRVHVSSCGLDVSYLCLHQSTPQRQLNRPGQRYPAACPIRGAGERAAAGPLGHSLRRFGMRLRKIFTTELASGRRPAAG